MSSSRTSRARADFPADLVAQGCAPFRKQAGSGSSETVIGTGRTARQRAVRRVRIACSTRTAHVASTPPCGYSRIFRIGDIPARGILNRATNGESGDDRMRGTGTPASRGYVLSS